MNAQAYLIMAGAPQTAWVYPVTEERTVIGREAACQIHALHPTISRRHCEVWVEDGKVYAQDLHSVNGVYVNGARIRKRRLAYGDLLQVGPLIVQLLRGLVPGERAFQIGAEGASSTVEPHLAGRTVALPNFSAVEQEIVKVLVDGQSEKEAAAVLGLSAHAVHSHVKQIYRQLGISSRAQLVVWYWRGRVE
jgi:pSer/pThr/pTyr-binding forkhead associated (FHA) protein